VSLARTVAEQLERASWIRRMFEIGIQLRKERGSENVFDVSLGNPEIEPPEAVIHALERIVSVPKAISRSLVSQAVSTPSA
jgi:aspartate aminotransferase